jgi:sulfite exporter TauE/SafE
MPATGTLEWTVLGSLFAAGLAGSLHCIGMCGPILFAFSQAFERAGQERPRAHRFPLLGDFVWYHAGRVWTYGLLGLVAGFAGHGLRTGSPALGWQRGTSLLCAGAVVLSGVVLTGLVRAPRLEAVLGTCGLGKLRGRSWFAALVRTPGVTPRLLLGSLMGLLPCGLVYAALVLAATMPTPAHAAAGMLLFGVGTLPSLSAVLIAGRAAPRWLRLHGTRLVGAALILVGGLMLARAIAVVPGERCPACADRVSVTDLRP